MCDRRQRCLGGDLHYSKESSLHSCSVCGNLGDELLEHWLSSHKRNNWRTTERSSGGTCSTSPGCGRRAESGSWGSTGGMCSSLAGGDSSERKWCPAASAGTAAPEPYKGCHTQLGFQGPPGQWMAQDHQPSWQAREGTREGFTAGTAEPWGTGGFPPSQTKAKLAAHPGWVYGGHSAFSACWRCPPHLLLPCAQQSGSIGKCDVGLSTYLGSSPSSPASCTVARMTARAFFFLSPVTCTAWNNKPLQTKLALNVCQVLSQFQTIFRARY